MRTRFALLFLTFSLLTACGSSSMNTPVESIPEPTPSEEVFLESPIPSEEETLPPEESVSPVVNTYMYEGAVEDFLEPFDEYSWEREYAPEYIMIHFTSAVMLDPKNPYDMDSVRSIFEDYDISIHYILDRDGTVYCYMPETRVAWHAGVGTFADDEKYTNKMNYYAIGIEILAIGSENDMAQYLDRYQYKALDTELIGFTDAQYDALRDLVSDLCLRYNIPMDKAHVIGHEEYSPGKNDPGELFDWERLLHTETDSEENQ